MICFQFIKKQVKTWRIRSQILIIQITTMTVVSLLLTLCIFFSFQNAFNFFKEDAQQILIMNFIFRSTNSQLFAYSRLLRQKFNQGMNLVENLSLLNQFIEQSNIKFFSDTSDCQLSEYQKDSFENSLAYCYQIFNCQSQLQNENLYLDNFKKTSYLLTQTLAYQIEYSIYFTSISKDCYFSYFPRSDFSKFVPSSRKWFQNHVQEMNKSQYVISEPYLNLFGGVYLTATKTMYHDGQEKIGIAAIDLNFSQIYQTYQDEQQLFVLDKNGRILVNKYYTENSSTVEYLQNQSLFGFNQTDFEILQNGTQPKSLQCNFSIPNTVCLEDKNHHIYWYFRKTQITNNYTVLLLFNSKAYDKLLLLLEDTLSILYEKIFNILILGALCVFSISLITYFLSLLILQKPIDKLVNSFSKYVLTGNQIKYFIGDQESQDSMDKLQDAFCRLASNTNGLKSKRNEYVEQLDSQVEYPINYYRNSKILNQKNLPEIQDYELKMSKFFIRQKLACILNSK